MKPPTPVNRDPLKNIEFFELRCPACHQKRLTTRRTIPAKGTNRPKVQYKLCKLCGHTFTVTVH